MLKFSLFFRDFLLNNFFITLKSLFSKYSWLKCSRLFIIQSNFDTKLLVEVLRAEVTVREETSIVLNAFFVNLSHFNNVLFTQR
jgi:hypothetical protein